MLHVYCQVKSLKRTQSSLLKTHACDRKFSLKRYGKTENSAFSQFIMMLNLLRSMPHSQGTVVVARERNVKRTKVFFFFSISEIMVYILSVKDIL